MKRLVIFMIVGAVMMVAAVLATSLWEGWDSIVLVQSVLGGGGGGMLAVAAVALLIELVQPGYLEARRRRNPESPWKGVRLVLVIGVPLVVGWIVGEFAGVLIAYIALVAVIVVGGFFVVPGLKLISDIVDRLSGR